MISYINEILDLIIKSSIIFGILLLSYFYLKIGNLDRKIERLKRGFEIEGNSKRGQGRGITEEVIDRQIEELQKVNDEATAPLERERQRLLSKIPFIR